MVLEANLFLALLVFFGLGFSKGLISSKGIMKRFPRRKKPTLIAAIVLTALFLASGIMSYEKLSLLKNETEQQESDIENPKEIIETLSEIDVFAILSGMILPLIIFLLGYGKIRKRGKKILTGITAIYYLLYLIYWTSDLIPKDIAIGLFIAFQLGVVSGVFIGTGLYKQI